MAQNPVFFRVNREGLAQTGSPRMRRQPAILSIYIRYLWVAIKARHCSPLHGDRRSVEGRKPQRKGDFPPSFAPGLCRAFSNVRTRPASGWSDDQPRLVNGSQQPPALMGLALDVGLTGFTWGIERIEGEVEIMLGRFARVDGAAQRLRDRHLHGRPDRAPARSAPPILHDRNRLDRCLGIQ
jgi:hypothetical protein